MLTVETFYDRLVRSTFKQHFRTSFNHHLVDVLYAQGKIRYIDKDAGIFEVCDAVNDGHGRDADDNAE